MCMPMPVLNHIDSSLRTFRSLFALAVQFTGEHVGDAAEGSATNRVSGITYVSAQSRVHTTDPQLCLLSCRV